MSVGADRVKFKQFEDFLDHKLAIAHGLGLLLGVVVIFVFHAGVG